jgi:hypothetical protein
MNNKNKNKTNQIEQSNNSFLKDDPSKNNLAQKHKEYLGMDVPDNYFSQSKQDILKSLPMTSEDKRTVFGLKPIYAYPLAASVILLLGIFIWMMQHDTNIVNTQTINVAEVDFTNMDDSDVLITSLLVDDTDINTYMDEFMVEKVVVEVSQTDQQLENLFINSLLIDDSKAEDYVQKGILENFVL